MKVRAHLVLLLLIGGCKDYPDSASFSDPPAVPGVGSSGSASSTSGAPSTGGAGEGEGGSAVLPTGGVASVAGTSSVAGTNGVDDAAGAGGSPREPTPEEPPACGNGKREGDEQCDDGGTPGEDGCNEECRVVCADFGESAQTSADFHCYVGYDEADFAGAVADCEARGAHLVTIANRAENDLVRALVRSSKWIGAAEDVALTSEAAGEHVWVTGEVFSFENWDSRQPDRAGARCEANTSNGRCYEHCAFMQSDGTWADARCDLVDGYVCEWEPAGS